MVYSRQKETSPAGEIQNIFAIEPPINLATRTDWKRSPERKEIIFFSPGKNVNGEGVPHLDCNKNSLFKMFKPGQGSQAI